jgi:hypothetical protein
VRVEPRNPATVKGETFIQINYNSQQPAPTSSTQLLNAYRANRASAWLKNRCVADGSEFSQKKLYCRMGNQPTGTDIREYDFGNLYIFYEGIDTALTYDIWLDIDVILYDPIIPDDEVPSMVDYVHIESLVTNMVPLAITNGIKSGNGGMSYGMSGNGTVTFDNGGYYACQHYWKDSDTKLSGYITTSSEVNITHVSGYMSATDNFFSNNDTKFAMFAHCIKVAYGGGSYKLVGPSGGTTTSTMQTNIMFLGFLDSNPAPPELKRLRYGGKKMDQTVKEKFDPTQLFSNPIFMQQLKQFMKDEGTLLMVSEPPSPQLNALGTAKPSTSAAAGGTGAETPLKSDEKKNESVSKKGKSTSK